MGLQTLATVLMMTTMAVGLLEAQQTAGSDRAKALQEGETLEQEGERAKALEVYRRLLASDAGHVGAHLGVGRLLDLEGKYAEARRHLQRAIDGAADSEMNQALSAMAISYAFEGNAKDAARYYQRAFERHEKAGALEQAGGTANALGRVYLETGDVGNAEKWYRTGYASATKAAAAPDRKDLAEMRWHHAQARIAARRKQFEAARKHVDEVRSIVARGTLDESQRLQSSHVAGYVAFYEGQYAQAISELSKSEQNDPFVLSLLAQAHDQQKDHSRARELYSKIVRMSGHSVQMALSRPLAERRLAGQ